MHAARYIEYIYDRNVLKLYGIIPQSSIILNAFGYLAFSELHQHDVSMPSSHDELSVGLLKAKISIYTECGYILLMNM